MSAIFYCQYWYSIAKEIKTINVSQLQHLWLQLSVRCFVIHNRIFVPTGLLIAVFTLVSSLETGCFATCDASCFFLDCFCRNERFRFWHPAGSSRDSERGKWLGLVTHCGLRIYKVHLALRFAGCSSNSLHIPRKTKKKALWIRIFIRRSDCGAPSPCEWAKGWMCGQHHHSRSSLLHYLSIRNQTKCEPMCLRMQMRLSGRDGLCNGEQHLHSGCAGLRQTWDPKRLQCR